MTAPHRFITGTSRPSTSRRITLPSRCISTCSHVSSSISLPRNPAPSPRANTSSLYPSNGARAVSRPFTAESASTHPTNTGRPDVLPGSAERDRCPPARGAVRPADSPRRGHPLEWSLRRADTPGEAPPVSKEPRRPRAAHVTRNRERCNSREASTVPRHGRFDVSADTRPLILRHALRSHNGSSVPIDVPRHAREPHDISTTYGTV